MFSPLSSNREQVRRSMAEMEQEKILAPRKRLYTTVFAQCFSPCGKYLVTATNFGLISVFSLQTALSPETTEESWRPYHSFKADDGAIYTLLSTDRLLISGGVGGIHGWQWSDVLTKWSPSTKDTPSARLKCLLEQGVHWREAPKKIFSFAIPSEDRFAEPETNALALTNQDAHEECLLAGCGDNNIHLFDLHSGALVRSLEGHTDYIHDLTVRANSHECISASEDGSARIWDTRLKGEAAHIIEPYKNEECARPDFGKWLSCVNVDKADDWMVCGGGPKLCLWHLRSLAATTVFDTPGAASHCALFHEDTIISAGSEAFAHHWSVNGAKRAQVPCTPSSVYSVAINDKQPNTKILSIAGNSNKIDICTNFGYKAFSMAVC